MNKIYFLSTLLIVLISRFSYSQFNTILDFTGTANGSAPNGSLIYDGTFLYGMTAGGGSNNMGTIFKILPNGTGYAKLLDFEGVSNGANPYGSLLSDGIYLYGMTSFGGANNFGTLFKIMPDGTSFEKLLDFDGTVNGKEPNGTLFSDGTFLYGMTRYGGVYDKGTVFKILPDGNGYVKLLDFAGATNGSEGVSSLIFDGSFLYGMTSAGGTFGQGTIFKIMPDGTGYTKLMEFAGSTNGRNPKGSLYSDGTFLYGMTRWGGLFNEGVIFKILPDGTDYMKLLDFEGSTNGSEPFGSLISNGGFLYGVTRYGGTYDIGTIFKIKPDGTSFAKILNFSGAPNGGIPKGSLVSDANFLFGMSSVSSANNSNGGVFKFCIPPTAINTGAYCAGDTIQLNTTAGNTYYWSGPNSFTSTVQNPSILSSTTAMSGTYTVTVYKIVGCASSTSTVVTIDTIPVATNTGEYCVGETIQLNSSAGYNHIWNGPLAFSDSIQNPIIASSTIDMSGTYVVSLTNTCGNFTTSTEVMVDSCLSLEEISLNAITISPNPTMGNVDIFSTIQGEQYVSISNLFGEIVLIKEVNFNTTKSISFDLSNVPTGVYILKIGNSIERIIKQ